MRIINTIILIIILLSILLRKKEKFSQKTKEEIKLNFSNKDSIFMITKVLKYIEQSEKGIKFFKTNNLIHSNKLIYSESGDFSGFIFSIKKGNRLEIGFSNLEKDSKDELTHSFEILDESSFRIKEKDQNGNYSVQDIDFCKLIRTDTCFNTKNTYKFDPEKNLLAIILFNNRANYFIIKRNDSSEDKGSDESTLSDSDNKDKNYGSMLIHKGRIKLNFPYNLKVITKDKEALLPTLLWCKHTKYLNPQVPWIVETKFKDDYDKEPLDIVPMETHKNEILPSPAPEIEQEIDLSKFFDNGIRKIIIEDIKIDTNVLTIFFRHNLSKLFLQLNDKNIFVKFILDDDTYIFRQISIKNIYNNKFIPKKKMFTAELKLKIFRIFKSLEIKIGDVSSYNFKLDGDDLQLLNLGFNNPSPS